MGKRAADPTAAALYVRVSTDEQAREGVSLAAQEERLRAYAVATGLSVAAFVREEGVSGAKPLADRPGGREVLSLVSHGTVRHVVSLKLDRLFRDAADCLTQTRAWDRSGVALHLVDMGGATINTATAMGRMFLTMAAGFAELERNLIAERTASAMAHMKRHGQVYSPVPFGYRCIDAGRLVPHAAEQAVIRDVQAWRAAGWTLRAIAAQLNHAGVPTKTTRRAGKATAGRWYASTVRYLLANDLHAPDILMPNP